MASGSFVFQLCENKRETQQQSSPLISDDEESFVVLGKSMTPESLPVRENLMGNEDVGGAISSESVLMHKILDEAIKCGEESIVNVEKMCSLPKEAAEESAGAETAQSAELTPEEIKQKVDLVIAENMKLKDTICQNNLSMKQQMETIEMWQREVQKTYQAHKEKFAEMKDYIGKLKEENLKLKEMVKALADGQEQEKFGGVGEDQREVELISAQKKIADLELAVDRFHSETWDLKAQLSAVAGHEAEISKLKEALAAASKTSEELRQQAVFDKITTDNAKQALLKEIDQLKTVIAKNEMRRTELEQCQVKSMKLINEKEKEVNELRGRLSQANVENGGFVALQTQALLNEIDQLKTVIAKKQQEEEQRQQTVFEKVTDDYAKQALLKEIEQLKTVIAKKQQEETQTAIHTPEEMSTMRQQLMNSQMRITELEQCQVKSMKLINEKEKEVDELRGRLSQANVESDGFVALQTQADLYKSDFEAERNAKNAIHAEKQQLEEDLRNLQRRNQQLIEEVEQLRLGDFVHVAAAANDASPKHKYACPKCNFRFADYQSLENHVHRCIELDMLP